MNQKIVLIAGGLALVTALAFSTLFQGPGPEAPPSAPGAAAPAPEGDPPPLTTSPQTPPGRTDQ